MKRQLWAKVAIAAGVVVIVLAMRPDKRLGLTERDVRKVTKGMGHQDVERILGSPHRREYRPRGQDSMPVGVGPSDSERRSASQATHEIWRWKRGLQLVSVAFDDSGLVVYVWADY